MSGRGRCRGRGRGQPVDEDPTVDQEAGLGQIPQLIAAAFAPFAARMEAFLAGGRVTPPPQTPDTAPGPGATVMAPPAGAGAAMAAEIAAEHKVRLRLVERFQKLRAPEFQGARTL